MMISKFLVDGARIATNFLQLPVQCTGRVHISLLYHKHDLTQLNLHLIGIGDSYYQASTTVEQYNLIVLLPY